MHDAGVGVGSGNLGRLLSPTSSKLQTLQRCGKVYSYGLCGPALERMTTLALDGVALDDQVDRYFDVCCRDVDEGRVIIGVVDYIAAQVT